MIKLSSLKPPKKTDGKNRFGEIPVICWQTMIFCEYCNVVFNKQISKDSASCVVYCTVQYPYIRLFTGAGYSVAGGQVSWLSQTFGQNIHY
jgi:hypothetical protein